MATKKKKNLFQRYFVPFGLKQFFCVTAFIASIMLILGLALFSKTVVILPIGLGLFLVATLAEMFRCAKILTGKINKRSPEFKQTVVNIIIMGILTAITIFALYWYFFQQL